jgi:hypothetical protein
MGDTQTDGDGHDNPALFTGPIRRPYAAIFSFCAGVMAPMPMFGGTTPARLRRRHRGNGSAAASFGGVKLFPADALGGALLLRCLASRPEIPALFACLPHQFRCV